MPHDLLQLAERPAGARYSVANECRIASGPSRPASSSGSPARQALANGVWPRGTYEYKLRHDGVAWRAPDRSAVFLPWSAMAGAYETERLFLLMDTEGRTVRGFVPKTGRSDLPSDAELGRLIRERIRAAVS